MSSAALKAIQDGQATGKFFRALAEKELRERLERIEKMLQAVLPLVPKRVLQKVVKDEPKLIMERVAEFYRVPVDAMIGRNKWDDANWARHVAMNLMFELFGWSDKRIGPIFVRSHATVRHARMKVADSVQFEPEAKAKYETLRDALKQELGLA